ncbi:MAG: hypothetical protein EXX96DRAFT_229759 [Benjaminiella poitrasii]|nr:MAG: hypothetical protein EXX96DRAFT_229759 [Benjaminiella poitrasii]
MSYTRQVVKQEDLQQLLVFFKHLHITPTTPQRKPFNFTRSLPNIPFPKIISGTLDLSSFVDCKGFHFLLLAKYIISVGLHKIIATNLLYVLLLPMLSFLLFILTQSLLLRISSFSFLIVLFKSLFSIVYSTTV